MYLMDYHTHSAASPDGSEPVFRLAAAAVQAGLSELAVTDHYDLDDENGNEGTVGYDGAAVGKQLEQAKERYGDKLSLLWGIELGEAAHAPDRAKQAAEAYPFDFVIGSVHNMSGLADFYLLRYNDPEACYRHLGMYFDELIRLAGLGGFDALGHLTYPLRYMTGRDGIKLDISRYEEQLRALFKILIEGGRGIEVNTSGLRGKLGDIMPTLWCLRLYRECGGEIVTVGSDAHRSKDVGAGIREGYAALFASGFRYVTAFEKRKPVFHKL
jgi:histidinol-phosphatase (PHP family)